MAAASLPAPGTELGPCEDESCGHTDCQATRGMAREWCRYCVKTIGYDVRFYRCDDGRFAHAVCLEEAVERKQAARLLANGKPPTPKQRATVLDSVATLVRCNLSAAARGYHNDRADGFVAGMFGEIPHAVKDDGAGRAWTLGWRVGMAVRDGLGLERPDWCPKPSKVGREQAGRAKPMPADDAPLHVQHAWLCHGADENGEGGEPCPDGCDVAADPIRRKLYEGEG